MLGFVIIMATVVLMAIGAAVYFKLLPSKTLEKFTFFATHEITASS